LIALRHNTITPQSFSSAVWQLTLINPLQHTDVTTRIKVNRVLHIVWLLLTSAIGLHHTHAKNVNEYLPGIPRAVSWPPPQKHFKVIGTIY